MLVDIQHPAPVTHVPRGARKARTTHVAAVTPVEMRRVASSEVRHVHSLGDPDPSYRRGDTELREHGGTLWKVLWEARDTNGATRPVTHGEWTGFLSGRMREDEFGFHALARHFKRSPLVAVPAAWWAPDATGAHVMWTRGARFEDAGQRRVDADGREAAAADLTAWAASEILLTDTEVMARYRPVAAFPKQFAGLQFVDPPTLDRPGMPPFAPSAYRERLGLWEVGTPPDELLTPQFADSASALAGFEEIDEVAFLANHAPGRVNAYLDSRSRTVAGGRKDEILAGLAGHRARLLAFEAPAATGLLSGADAEAALASVNEALAFAWREFLPHPEAATWERFRRHVTMVAAPRPDRVADHDAEAMEGLGMGMAP